MTLYRLFLVTHRWIGLAATVFLLILSITGTILVYQPEIDRFFHRRRYPITPTEHRLPLDSIVAIAERALPGRKAQSIYPPVSPDLAVRVNFGRRVVIVDPYRGLVLASRGTGQSMLQRIRGLHTSLLMGNRGIVFTVAASWAAVFLTVGGIVLWWRLRIWRVVRTGSWRGINFDLHNVVGLVSSLGILIFAGTGALLDVGRPMDRLYRRYFGDAPNTRLLPASTPRPTRLSIDSLARLGDPVVPGPIREIQLGNGPLSPVILVKQAPGERGFRARNMVWLDPYDGRVRGSVDQNQRPLGTRIVFLIQDWHVGGYPGGWSRIYALLSCLLLAFQTVSGTLIWWKPRRSARTA